MSDGTNGLPRVGMPSKGQSMVIYSYRPHSENHVHWQRRMTLLERLSMWILGKVMRTGKGVNHDQP